MKRIWGSFVKSPCGNPTATITRPDNTTAYAVGDVFGQNPACNTTFLNVLNEPGASFYLVGIKLIYNASAVPASMSTFTIHLFNAAPTAIADNTAWALIAADKDKYLGNVVITLPVDLGGVLIMHMDGLSLKRKLAASSTTLYAQLVTNGNFTPAAEDVVNVSLEIEVA